MLTSGANQYLHPDYLSPLPTTLDAKKSPLALLAQTCSQIGADPPSNKSLFSSSDKSCGNKSRNKSADRERNSPSSGTPTGRISEKASTPEEQQHQQQQQQQQQQRSASSHSNSGRSRTPAGANRRCASNQSASSSSRTVTPQGGKTAEGVVPFLGEAIPSRLGSPMDIMSSGLSCGGRSTMANGEERGSPVLPSKSPYSAVGVLAMTDPALKDLPLGTFKLGLPPTSSSTAYQLGYPSSASQLPLEAMSAGSSLLSQHHAALKNGLAATACNPYLSYAASRLKSPTCSSSGGCADSSMTAAAAAAAAAAVCRDPYCTGCQLNSHLLAAAAAAAAAATSARSSGSSSVQQQQHTSNSKITVNSNSLAPTAPSTASPCPAGCVQCDHNNKSSCGSSSPYALAAAAYAHAQLTALAAASQLPYVCNWMAGDTVYCGKRFSTSDELLQHLRNHTNSIAVSSASSSVVDSSNAAAAAVATATALSILSPPLPPPPSSSFPLTGAHPFFSRTYPTPPLSPLATVRYHPYGKSTPPLLPPSLSSLGFALPPPHGLPPAPHPPPPPPSHPHPYFSAYSLYGAPRLGAASGLHQ